jgi:DNA invertase Pin-like site-specific DNA recombinase
MLKDSRNKNILKLFFKDLVSISEIAKQYNLSRPTVVDLILKHDYVNGKIVNITKGRKEVSKNEKWKELPLDTKYKYFISDFGRIWSEYRHALLRCKISFGYRAITLSIDNKRKDYLVHRLVAMCFIGDVEGKIVIHNDFDKLNNQVRNLKIISNKSYNRNNPKSAQRFKLNTELDNPKQLRQRKLNAKDVAFIKKNLNKGGSVKKLADEFKISKMQVERIHRGDCWPDVLPNLTRKRNKKPNTNIKTVKYIKEMLKKGFSGVEISKKTGVNTTVISRINNNKAYKDI